MSEQVATVTWINGPVIRARGSRTVGMLELVEVGEEHLVGEVIGLQGDIITAQVYEETSGMRPGAPVFGTGLPLSVELGPGLLGMVFDGVQRPLAARDVLRRRGGGADAAPACCLAGWSVAVSVRATVARRSSGPARRLRFHRATNCLPAPPVLATAA